MRSKHILALLTLIPLPGFGQTDPALTESPVLSRRAAAISELHAADLEHQAEVRRAQSAPEQSKVAPTVHAKARPTQLIDIAGAGGRFVATFRLPNGDIGSFSDKDTVPGFGQIRSIGAETVTDMRGRVVHPHPEETAP